MISAGLHELIKFITTHRLNYLLISIFGIKNCDSVKKARKWLDSNGIAYKFVDFRTDGVSTETLASWIGPETVKLLVNKRSTTWKNLNPSKQTQINGWLSLVNEGDREAAKSLAASLVENLTLIKRPVAKHSHGITIGFSPQEYQALFSH